MGFNYAIEKAKFEREWTQLRVEYEKAGMSNEKINILHDYDWGKFQERTDLRYSHAGIQRSPI